MRIAKWYLNKRFTALLVLITLLLASCGDSATTPTPVANSTTTAVTTSTSVTTTAASSTTIVAILATPVVSPTPATTVALPGSNGTPTPIIGAKGGATMKEAFAVVDQQVKSWQQDAVYVSVFNNLEKQLGIEPDGRCTEWFFQAISVKASKRTTWLVTWDNGKLAVTKSGEEDLPEDNVKFQAEQALPPIPSLIDTNEVMAVARANGGDKSDRPIGFRLAKSAREGASLSFDLIFEQGSKTLLIRVDALTGKILDNARG